MTPPVVCTIIAANYLAQARVLACSIAEQHPGERLKVLIIDDVDGRIDQTHEPFDVLRPDELPLTRREFHELAAYYEVIELATAIKPRLLRMLVAQHRPRPVIYLDPDILVLCPLDELARICRAHPLVLTPHTTTPMVHDELRPTEFDILASGAWNLGYIGVSEGAEPFLDWWAERLRFDALVDHANMRFTDQRWVDLAPGYFDVHPLRDPGYNVAYWNADQRPVKWTGERYLVGGGPLVFFHFSGFDPALPHVLSKHQGTQPRVLLSEHPGIRRLCDRYADLLRAAGLDDLRRIHYRWARLPDGTPITAAIRATVRRALMERAAGRPHEPPPDPFDPASLPAFMRWLGAPEPAESAVVPRLFLQIYRQRRELRTAFPNPDSVDAARFRSWALEIGCEQYAVPEAVAGICSGPDGWTAPTDGLSWSGGEPLQPGLLVAGYLESALGLGEAARLALRAMDAEGLPCSACSFGVTRSPRLDDGAARPPLRTDLNTNLIWVNADQLPHFIRAVGIEFFAGRYTVGHWVWETEKLPDSMAQMSRFVDEIWTPSEFSRAAIQSATDKPVWVLPHALVTPVLNGGRGPEELGVPAGFAFVFVFDFLSTLTRKNPIGLIHAFCRAFEPNEGAVLFLKSLNGVHRPLEVERLRYAIGDRPDIVLVDEYFTTSECTTILARADCYVSLHRAEGFGLTMAEAMLLGTPVIATGYSGNLDFMSDETAYLVPARQVPVGPEAEFYPADHTWGEPDLDLAAELMRRVYESPADARRRALAGRDAVLQRHGQARIARFLKTRFERIQDKLDSGFQSDVPDNVRTFLTESFAGRHRAAASVRAAAREPRRQAKASVQLPGGSIDQPSSGQIVPRAGLRVSGWAATETGPCSRVELTLDDVPLGNARLGLHRPDVARATDSAVSALSGFELLVDLSALAELTGSHLTLGGYAVGGDGIAIGLAPVRLQVRDAGEPRGGENLGPRLRVPAGRGSSRRSDPIRVLICSHDLSYAGAPLALAEMSRRIAAEGDFELEVLSFAEGPLRGTFEQLAGGVHVSESLARCSGAEYEAGIAELATWVASRDCDVALVNSVIAFPAADACVRLGVPTAWAIHETYELPLIPLAFGLDGTVSERLEETLRNANRLLFSCQATQATYQRYLPSVQCVTAPYGVDIEALDAWRAGFDRASARRAKGLASAAATVITCVGTIEPRKGQVPLIQAFAEIADRHPGAMLELLGGSDDAATEAARIATMEFGVTERVSIEPVRRDVRPCYGTADLLVSASDVESLPRSMMEAMALGLPVLATDVAGVPELISDGHTGWLCEPRDVNALTDALDRVLSLDAEVRAGVAASARTKIAREFRSDVRSRAWSELLRELA